MSALWHGHDASNVIHRPGMKRVMDMRTQYHERLWIRARDAQGKGKVYVARRLMRMMQRIGRAQYRAMMRAPQG